MKNVVKLTKQKLINILINWNYGAQPASVQYVINPTLSAIGKAKFGQITSVKNCGGFVGYIYENSVKTEIKKENFSQSEIDSFMAQPLWKGVGRRISTACSEHIKKGTKYLTFKYQQTFKSYFFDKDLNLLTSNDLLNCFPEKADSFLENPVYHREINIDNVRKLKFKRVTYIIEG
jgi:hypothetical protein